MFFAAGAVAAGLVEVAAVRRPDRPWRRNGVAVRAPKIGHTLMTVYGLRMAAVFTISATTLASRLRLVPRWLVLLGYATALVLLLGAGIVPWLELVFPAWVFVHQCPHPRRGVPRRRGGTAATIDAGWIAEVRP